MAKRRVSGAVVKVPLGGGTHTYARVMKSSMAFYDAKTKDDLAYDDIKDKALLFIIPVMHKAVTSGRWPIVGTYPLEARFQKEPEYFNQDSLDPKIIRDLSRRQDAKGNET